MTPPFPAATRYSWLVDEDIKDLDVLFLAHVTDHRDALASRGFDVGDRGVHGPRQPWMRLGRLGQQHDIRAVPGGGKRDGQPDAPAAARDDERAVSERGHGPPRCAACRW